MEWIAAHRVFMGSDLFVAMSVGIFGEWVAC